MHRPALVCALVLLAACRQSAGFEAPPASFTEVTVRVEGDSVERVAARVDSSFFGRVSPFLGRPFARQEYGGTDAVVLLSEDYWRERHGARPDIIGSQLGIDGVSRTVVGIMPEQVDLPSGVALWMPRE
jgi:hypothetical protein